MMTGAPYRFAAHASVFAALFAAVLFLGDRFLPWLPPDASVLFRDMAVGSVTRLHRSEGRILYLGDSVVDSVAMDERGQPKLPELLAKSLGMPVTNASRAAFGPRMYLALVAALERQQVRPHAIVVPINLRSFSPHWELQPSWRFGPERAMLETGIHAPIRALAVFKVDFGSTSYEAFRDAPVIVDGRYMGPLGVLDPPLGAGFGSVGNPRGACLARYATDVRRSSQFGLLDSLFSRLASFEVPVVLYLTPVDLEYVGDFLDDREMAAVHGNLSILRSQLERSRLPWLDLAGSLSRDAFDHPEEFPHEHLRQPGRELVADRLAGSLRAR